MTAKELFNRLAQNDNWLAGDMDLEDKPALIRYRPELDEFISSGLFTFRFSVVWNVESVDEMGLPEDHESDLIYDFEDRILEIMEDGLIAVLAYIKTSNGKSIWTFYSNSEKIPGAMDQAIFGNSSAELIPMVKDAAWEDYTKFKIGLVLGGFEPFNDEE